MTDKEVGELWQNHKHSNWSNPHNCPVQQLIRKLVEERANNIRAERGAATVAFFIKAALRDFGIDPETWEKAK